MLKFQPMYGQMETFLRIGRVMTSRQIKKKRLRLKQADDDEVHMDWTQWKLCIHSNFYVNYNAATCASDNSLTPNSVQHHLD